jgi:hypothetical protein
LRADAHADEGDEQVRRPVRMADGAPVAHRDGHGRLAVELADHDAAAQGLLVVELGELAQRLLVGRG